MANSASAVRESAQSTQHRRSWCSARIVLPAVNHTKASCHNSPVNIFSPPPQSHLRSEELRSKPRKAALCRVLRGLRPKTWPRQAKRTWAGSSHLFAISARDPVRFSCTSKRSRTKVHYLPCTSPLASHTRPCTSSTGGRRVSGSESGVLELEQMPWRAGYASHAALHALRWPFSDHRPRI